MSSRSRTLAPPSEPGYGPPPWMATLRSVQQRIVYTIACLAMPFYPTTYDCRATLQGVKFSRS